MKTNSVWCQCGFHDWEIIDRTSKEQIDLDIRNIRGVRVWGASQCLVHRVCLDCGKEQNTIAAYRLFAASELQEREQRRIKALELTGAMTERKQ